jgi:hypothetical protein
MFYYTQKRDRRAAWPEWEAHTHKTRKDSGGATSGDAARLGRALQDVGEAAFQVAKE